MTACVVIHASRSTRGLPGGVSFRFRLQTSNRRGLGAKDVFYVQRAEALSKPASAAGGGVGREHHELADALRDELDVGLHVGHLVQACLLVLAEALEFRLRERHGLVVTR